MVEIYDFGCDICIIFLVVFFNRFIFNILQDLNICILVNDFLFLVVYDGIYVLDNIFKVLNILIFVLLILIIFGYFIGGVCSLLIDNDFLWEK